MAENLSEMNMNDEKDVEGGSIATCRICWQSRDGVKDGVLISPCVCKGTQQFVHRSCLDRWRSVKAGFEFSHCTTCKAQFHLRFVELEGISWHKIKFILSVSRNIILEFLALQTVIAVLGGLVYLADHKHGYLQDLFNDHWDRVLLRHPILFYYCAGMIMLLVLLHLHGLIYQCCCTNMCSELCSMGPCVTIVGIVCMVMFIIPAFLYYVCYESAVAGPWRHYRQRELTKEYVVEDLNGCYRAPKELDPVHMKRLKSLNLL